ncbi:MAG: ATP-binding cassette domain-containing protein [Bacilli bacterium]
MIKIKNLDKYFFEGKRNEIHVLNDISLSIEGKGLLMILGRSGSGKSTLLNVIGGLDSAKGSISYDETTFDSYQMGKIDKFRSKNIGYIFQNYMLLDNFTVKENINNTLILLGMCDEKERNKRIDESLNATGMYRYRNKLCNALSGGQRQRVGIARALAKDADILIADEPTGNLDSKNSTEILKIIKEISKNKLVIMVTHNETLAKQYGDRIINFQNGQIFSDVANVATGSKRIINENDVFVKDFKAEEHIIDDKVKINVLSDDVNNDECLNIKIIKRNGKYLLFADENVSINPNVNLLDESKEEVMETLEKEDAELSLFDLSDFNKDTPNKNISLFKFVWIEIKQIFATKKKFRKSIFNFTNFGIGIALAFLTAYLFTFTAINFSQHRINECFPATYVSNSTEKQGQVISNKKALMYFNFMNDKESGIDSYVSDSSDFIYKNWFSLFNGKGDTSIHCIYTSSDYYKGPIKLVAGELPKSHFEVCVDILTVDFFKNNTYTFDITTEDYIGSRINTRKNANGENLVYTIVGVTDNGFNSLLFTPEDYDVAAQSLTNYYGQAPYTYTAGFDPLIEKIDLLENSDLTAEDKKDPVIKPKPCNIYVSEQLLALFPNYFKSSIFNICKKYNDPSNKISMYFADIEQAEKLIKSSVNNITTIPMHLQDDSLIITEGRKAINANEIVVSDSLTGIGLTEFNDLYKVVGKYKASSLRDSFYSYTTLSGFHYFLFNSGFTTFFNRLYPLSETAVFTNNPLQVEKYLQEKLGKDYKCGNVGTYIMDNETKYKVQQQIVILSLFISFLTILVVLVILHGRTKLISKQYSVAVYRCLGVSKTSISKLFLAEGIAIFTIYTTPGFIVGLLIANIFRIFENATPLIYLGIFGAYVLLFLVSIGALIIPLILLLRKTPHKIAIKYDI